jgi:uncharacterized damage-inducible protein DinB
MAADRVEPPYAGDERTTLVGFLDYLRETMIWKLEGLSEEQARWKPAASSNSLLAMVKHLGYVENWWFSTCFHGDEDPLPYSSDDPDADFRVGDHETVAGVIAFYRSEIHKSNKVVAEASALEDMSAIPARDARRSLRWILVHMVEETARHAGHADITRELIDGSTGE